MQYDEIINCPKSGGNLCYKVEINNEITNYLSISCGFWTNSLMISGSDFYNEQVSTLPELYKDIAWTDPETNFIWIPNTINIEEKGMVFANGTHADDWNWAAVKAIPLEEGEEAKVEGQKYKMDMANMTLFKERDYMDALSHIGLLPE